MTLAECSSPSSSSVASTSTTSSTRPRYAVAAEDKPRVVYHRRSGTLRTTHEQAQIAQQRSRNLYKSVSEGHIAIDTILAIPIDWEGVAAEMQLSQITKERDGENRLPTMDPWTVKTKARPRRLKKMHDSKSEEFGSSLVSSSELEDSKISLMSQSTTSRPSSALGLNVDSMMITGSTLPVFVDRADSECPPSPAFSLHHDVDSPSSSCSASECSISTPPPSASDLSFGGEGEKDVSFDLKSYCSAFNDTDRDFVQGGEEWWAAPSTAVPV